jgi:hypothetical protein
MHNYCTPHIIKENSNFLIYRRNYILLSQVYCLRQVVKPPTIICNNFNRWQNCIFRELQGLCFQALIQSRVSENSTIVLFTISPYVHSYKSKICIRNSRQKNGMALFLVKILADGVRRAMDSDVLCIYPFNAIWKFPANIKVFLNFCKYLFFWRRRMLCL